MADYTLIPMERSLTKIIEYRVTAGLGYREPYKKPCDGQKKQIDDLMKQHGSFHDPPDFLELTLARMERDTAPTAEAYFERSEAYMDLFKRVAAGFSAKAKEILEKPDK